MPGWISIILLAASLGRWKINTTPSVITLFSSSWHCWRAMGWGSFKGGFWELFVTIQQQGKELSMGCRDSSWDAGTLHGMQGPFLQCRNSLCNEFFWPKSLPRSSPGPPNIYGMRQDLPGPHQAPVPGIWQRLMRVSLPEGPRAGAKLGLDIDIESWLFERHNSLCLLQS